jgi:hypothetical protein
VILIGCPRFGLEGFAKKSMGFRALIERERPFGQFWNCRLQKKLNPAVSIVPREKLSARTKGIIDE